MGVQRLAKVEAIGKLIDEYHMNVLARLHQPEDSLPAEIRGLRTDATFQRAAPGPMEDGISMMQHRITNVLQEGKVSHRTRAPVLRQAGGDRIDSRPQSLQHWKVFQTTEDSPNHMSRIIGLRRG